MKASEARKALRAWKRRRPNERRAYTITEHRIDRAWFTVSLHINQRTESPVFGARTLAGATRRALRASP